MKANFIFQIMSRVTGAMTIVSARQAIRAFGRDEFRTIVNGEHPDFEAWVF